MKINPDQFRIRPGKKVSLQEWPTVVAPFYESKEAYQALLKINAVDLNSLQQRQYASGRYALLLIFQGMDASGKDGIIRHVLSGVNPEGCEVFSFKQPSAEELKHDFLWRTTCRLPARGRIGVFNRSYYEEVVIARVHPELLIPQNLPADTARGADLWNHRFQSIVNFELHLDRNGTKVLKFFLHLSKKQQAKRFVERIDDINKHWKLDKSDIQERNYWSKYMSAYAACLANTSTRHAPWYVVPADDKENARLIVSQIVVDGFNELKLAYPRSDAKQRRALKGIRKTLAR